MKKIFLLEDLDCAHCAGIIEKDAGKLPGVIKSSCNLLTQKLTLELNEDADYEEIKKAIVKLVDKTEPDVTVKAL